MPRSVACRAWVSRSLGEYSSLERKSPIFITAPIPGSAARKRDGSVKYVSRSVIASPEGYDIAMPNSVSAELLVTMKRVATVLKEHQVPFALAGGFAVYARGGSGSEH